MRRCQPKKSLSFIITVFTFFDISGTRLDILDSGSLNLMYYRARYYNTTTGRFLSRDPIDYEDGMNIYTYVDNNPVKYVDSSGLAKDPKCVKKCKKYQIACKVRGKIVCWIFKKTYLGLGKWCGKVYNAACRADYNTCVSNCPDEDEPDEEDCGEGDKGCGGGPGPGPSLW